MSSMYMYLLCVWVCVCVLPISLPIELYRVTDFGQAHSE